METLKEQLKRHEGLRLKPYKCSAGRLTIGYGRNIQDTGITRDEADYLLDNNIQAVKEELTGKLPWIMQLDEARKNVLFNMAFNLGVPGLLKFKSTLAAIELGDYFRAAEMMLQSKWAKQVGARARELSRQMELGGTVEDDIFTSTEEAIEDDLPGEDRKAKSEDSILAVLIKILTQIIKGR